MNTDHLRIQALETQLQLAKRDLATADDVAHQQRDYIAALRRRIDELHAELIAERKANAILQEGIATAVTRLRAIEAAEQALFEA